MFSFSIIIPVKSFELNLNSNSLHLYRHKSEGGNVSIKLYSNSTNILYLNILTLYQ